MIIRKDNIIENFHGTKVADPYRWLEDPLSSDTKEWVSHMDEKCANYFSSAPNKVIDRTRLETLHDYSKYYVPKMINKRLFYLQNDGLQNQAVLYMREEEHDPVVIIDPNEFSDDGTVALANHAMSKNGQLLAYAISKHGSDWQEIRVRNINTGEDLDDLIEFIKFTNIAWSPDHSGFYYSRFPEPGTVAPEDESKYSRVYFHRIGTKQEEDILVHEQPEDKEFDFSPFITDDGAYIGLYVFLGTANENRLYIKSLHSSDPFIRLLDAGDAAYYYITNEGTTFYFQTDLGAPNGRIITIDLNKPERENWVEVIPEQEDVIDFIKAIDDEFIIAYLHDAHHQLHVYNKTGEHVRRIKLLEIGSITDIQVNKEDKVIYFGMTSFLSPTTIYQYNVQTDQLNVLEKAQLLVETDAFETIQVFYSSKDGTKIPMFVTKPKDLSLNGENPVILYGYGGFNISLTPAFNPAILRWLEKGGVYAVANLRGGNEYGEDWHKDGILENKQNVFDDFIAAGEWLIENNYTNENKLSIMGGSNGGLLVAACMVQRPDLFGAVICRVPVIDMLRYHKFTIGRYWIPEFGSAENPEHFPFLYAYSPLHNVQDGEQYPPVLIATAESDDRVVPGHALKFAATLNEKADPNTRVVLRLEEKAGHGHGKPISKIIDEWVDFFAFLDKELSM
ncbi:prolyl oligopeptidase family protein [Virgibacillus soli]|uniref:prolyl oligopeptidase family serine peptidase n=1 Tax=Paracerasibacillus soli TaxID=480284 RepID=UPI0035EDE4F8